MYSCVVLLVKGVVEDLIFFKQRSCEEHRTEFYMLSEFQKLIYIYIYIVLHHMECIYVNIKNIM